MIVPLRQRRGVNLIQLDAGFVKHPKVAQHAVSNARVSSQNETPSTCPGSLLTFISRKQSAQSDEQELDIAVPVWPLSGVALATKRPAKNRTVHGRLHNKRLTAGLIANLRTLSTAGSAVAPLLLLKRPAIFFCDVRIMY